MNVKKNRISRAAELLVPAHNITGTKQFSHICRRPSKLHSFNTYVIFLLQSGHPHLLQSNIINLHLVCLSSNVQNVVSLLVTKMKEFRPSDYQK